METCAGESSAVLHFNNAPALVTVKTKAGVL